MPPSLLDTDTLSEVMKGRDPLVQRRARQYLASYGCFTFSIITRYEILRGLKAREATKQIAIFEERCRKSLVLPLTDEIVVRAADIYAVLHRKEKSPPLHCSPAPPLRRLPCSTTSHQVLRAVQQIVSNQEVMKGLTAVISS
jgi:predicted nucleic acid-binding protein